MERKTEEVYSFNSAARTFTRTTVVTETYSGGKIDTAWAVMKTWDWSNKGARIVTFNNENHSVTMTTNNNPTSIDDTWLQRYQINQNGKKIKRINYWGDGRDLVLSK